MASITKIGKRWRALVRKGGVTRCMTLGTRAQVAAWAATVENEIEQLKASGFLKPAGLTVGDLILRYERDIGPVKRWSASKSRDLRILKRTFGAELAGGLTHARIVEAFTRMYDEGAGGVAVSARIGYLIIVLATAANLWRINVPLEAARSARAALKEVGMITASKQRDRRVSDEEIERICAHFDVMDTHLPMRDLIHFAVASAMRVSEITRIRWTDLNEKDRTVTVRDRKDPRKKAGNDGDVPLLDFSGHDAFAIIMRQPRTSEFIFPFNCRTVGKYFIDAGLFLEIEDLNFHDLRHESVSRMFECGHKYSIPEVALVSGHRDWGHLRRYTNLRAADLHRAKAS
jgi:integrase